MLIYIVVNRFTKMAHLIPLPNQVNAKDIANIFLQHIQNLHGLLINIVLYRDTKLTSYFWQVVIDLLSVKTKLSKAFHLETDGRNKKINQEIEQYLRHYCYQQQDHGDELLLMAEFAYNSAKSETTSILPFEANYGMMPRKSLE